MPFVLKECTFETVGLCCGYTNGSRNLNHRNITIAPMKRLLLAVLSSTTALIAFNATAASVNGPVGPITLSWKVLQEEPDITPHYTTNKTATGTNILETTSSKSKSFQLNDAVLISFLANSLNTNIPAGSKLAYSEGAVYLVDKTGTNIVLDISSVVSITTPASVGTSVGSRTEKITTTKTTYTGLDSGTGAAYQVVTYNDTALTSANGLTSDFTFSGASTSSGSESYTETVTGISVSSFKGTVRNSFIMTGSGAGTIQGTNSVITGTVNGSESGPFEIPL